MQKLFQNFRKSISTIYRKYNTSQPSRVYPRNGRSINITDHIKLKMKKNMIISINTKKIDKIQYACLIKTS